jgi:hypothetical protein
MPAWRTTLAGQYLHPTLYTAKERGNNEGGKFNGEFRNVVTSTIVFGLISSNCACTSSSNNKPAQSSVCKGTLAPSRGAGHDALLSHVPFQ